MRLPKLNNCSGVKRKVKTKMEIFKTSNSSKSQWGAVLNYFALLPFSMFPSFYQSLFFFNIFLFALWKPICVFSYFVSPHLYCWTVEPQQEVDLQTSLDHIKKLVGHPPSCGQWHLTFQRSDAKVVKVWQTYAKSHKRWIQIIHFGANKTTLNGHRNKN